MSKTIIAFLGKSFLRMVALIIAVSILSFLLLVLSPIDPIDAYFTGISVSEEQKALVAAYWQFDKPPVERYLHWAGNMLKGDWGRSLIYNEPVMTVIADKFQASLWLMSVAWVGSGLFGFSLGVISGVNKGRWIDKIINSFALFCVSVPIFWLGLLFISVFSVELQWFPIALSTPIGKLSGEVTVAERLHHLALPAFTLSVTGVSGIILHTREKMIDAMDSNYMLFAKARGESLWQRVRRHGLRNVAIPAVTLHFASFAELFGGAILAEAVFSYPGLGGAVTLAGLRGDVALLLGIALFSAIFVFIGNLIANLLYLVINPEVREGAKAL